jgi:peptide/nickel transport system substrate-binding protein
MLQFRKSMTALAVLASACGVLGGTAGPAGAQTTLKAVMNSDVKILDPIWTTAYVQRAFGYMLWDVLFALDANYEVKPQMVDTWSVSDDKLTWTFTLREGLVCRTASR